jgi:hypothetical protein
LPREGTTLKGSRGAMAVVTVMNGSFRLLLWIDISTHGDGVLKPEKVQGNTIPSSVEGTLTRLQIAVANGVRSVANLVVAIRTGESFHPSMTDRLAYEF